MLRACLRSIVSLLPYCVAQVALQGVEGRRARTASCCMHVLVLTSGYKPSTLVALLLSVLGSSAYSMSLSEASASRLSLSDSSCRDCTASCSCCREEDRCRCCTACVPGPAWTCKKKTLLQGNLIQASQRCQHHLSCLSKLMLMHSNFMEGTGV